MCSVVYAGACNVAAKTNPENHVGAKNMDLTGVGLSLCSFSSGFWLGARKGTVFDFAATANL